MTSRRGEPKKSHVQFDYDKTKTKYMKAIEKYEVLRLWRAEVFKNIQKEMHLNKHKGMVTQHSQKYELFKTPNGADILILNRGKSPKIIECVSAEDSFDVFVDVHQATGHSGKEKMLQNMRQRYHVSTACLKIFLELCNVCNANKKIVRTSERNLTHTARVTILDLTAEQNGGFGYILVYKFRWSGFTILRPLTISNFEQDVALELLNIFLDFGPPVKILASETRLDLLTKALSYISTMTCDCNVLVEKNVKGEEVLNFNLLKTFQEWMTLSNSRQWSIACHLIQWKINNSNPDSEDPNKEGCPQSTHFKPNSMGEIAQLNREEIEDIITVETGSENDDDGPN